MKIEANAHTLLPPPAFVLPLPSGRRTGMQSGVDALPFAPRGVLFVRVRPGYALLQPDVG